MNRRTRTATGATNRPRTSTSGSVSARQASPIKPSTPRSRPLTSRSKLSSPRATSSRQSSRPVSSVVPKNNVRRESTHLAANRLRERFEGKFNSMTTAFRDLDKDGDGLINADELQGMLDLFGMPDIDAKIILAEIEGNGDANGSIDYREFLDWSTVKALTGEKKGAALGGVVNAKNLWEQNPKVVKIATMLREKGLGKKSLKTWFNAFDEDRDGQVSTEELHTMLANFGMKMKRSDVQEVLDCFDVDGDGGIHFSEFVEIVQDTTEDEAFDTRKEFESDGEEDDDDIGDWVQMAKPKERDPIKRAAMDARAQMALEATIKDILRKRGRMITLFRSFDDDGSGEVSTEEFTTGLQKFLWAKGLKTQELQIKALVDKVDVDGDGKIAYNEFFEQLGWATGYEDATTKKSERWKDLPALKGGKVLESAMGKLRDSLERRGYDPTMLRELLMAFRSLNFEDIHDNVSKDEFRGALEGSSGFRPTTKEMDVLVDALDLDGDGTICFREFAAALQETRGNSLDFNGTVKANMIRRLEKKPIQVKPQVDAQQILMTLHRGGMARENSMRQSARPADTGLAPPWLPLEDSCKLPTLRHLRSDCPWQTSSMRPMQEASPRKLISPSLKAKAAKRQLREREIVDGQQALFAREQIVENARLEKCYASLSRYMKKINKVEKKNFALGGGYGTTRRMFHGSRAEDSHGPLW